MIRMSLDIIVTRSFYVIFRGKQKLYKKFESALNDFAYITGKECKEISLTI